MIGEDREETFLEREEVVRFVERGDPHGETREHHGLDDLYIVTSQHRRPELNGLKVKQERKSVR